MAPDLPGHRQVRSTAVLGANELTAAPVGGKLVNGETSLTFEAICPWLDFAF